MNLRTVLATLGDVRSTSALRSVLSTAKAAGLQALYSRRYDELAPRAYSKAEFKRVAAEARDLLAELRSSLPPLENPELQPYWAETLSKIADALKRALPEDFLSIPGIRHAMVRRGWTEHQRVELAYLREQTELYQLVRESFRDSRVGGPHLECRELGCSSSALGYLYYLARLKHARARAGLEKLPERVTELGGGYGGFCRVYLWAHKPQEYTIIDLPEFCVVQYLFLRLSLPSERVRVSRSVEEPVPEGGIRLVPVQVALAHPERFSTQLFTSHFALTEAGKSVREMVYKSHFLGANEVYYIGQKGERWPVSVDPEVMTALSGEGWRKWAEPFHMKDCVEIFGAKIAQGRR